MKHFLATTAAAALLATSAYAQTAPAQSPFVDSAAESVADAQTVRASNLIGKSVYVTATDVTTQEIDTDAIDWERVGEVDDLVISPNGEINAVLLDIGGFLGLGERTVALSVDQLKLVSGMNDGDDYYVVFNGNAAALENAPEYDVAAIGAWADDSQADGSPVATDTAATEMEKATDPAMTDTDSAAAEPDVSTGDPAMADTDTAATGDTTADTSMETAEADSTMSAEDQEIYSAAPPAVSVDGWTQVQLDELTTEDLTGAVVFDAQMENIGEVGELFVSADGQLTGAELDIGGFLGIGEDHVRVGMDSLNIQRDMEVGDVRVYVDLTEESLKAMKETK
ncbi:PRC-barrel domain-containing protein [Pseudosulfitobacter sp. DSM 107133]|uniref:PRC-barrel domain-containing protein n=1 Tax=Pseudosulfitobacter sp. DSM 107133 TaxID=2883100 RepID=UPI000DF4C8C6|nr:PRC-barrel domain-containing protein [Pseudosulfitobacter sp. DSM 107133]UOA28415.1 hypothetical protein DSM107133_03162 [Pseudosulfitobacter sp. DSM 107133]